MSKSTIQVDAKGLSTAIKSIEKLPIKGDKGYGQFYLEGIPGWASLFVCAGNGTVQVGKVVPSLGDCAEGLTGFSACVNAPTLCEFLNRKKFKSKTPLSLTFEEGTLTLGSQGGSFSLKTSDGDSFPFMDGIDQEKFSEHHIGLDVTQFWSEGISKCLKAIPPKQTGHHGWDKVYFYSDGTVARTDSFVMAIYGPCKTDSLLFSLDTAVANQLSRVIQQNLEASHVPGEFGTLLLRFDGTLTQCSTNTTHEEGSELKSIPMMLGGSELPEESDWQRIDFESKPFLKVLKEILPWSKASQYRIQITTSFLAAETEAGTQKETFVHGGIVPGPFTVNGIWLENVLKSFDSDQVSMYFKDPRSPILVCAPGFFRGGLMPIRNKESV